jgi:hypothetical protein
MAETDRIPSSSSSLLGKFSTVVPKHSFDENAIGAQTFTGTRISSVDGRTSSVENPIMSPLIINEEGADIHKDKLHSEVYVENSAPLTVFLLINTMIGNYALITLYTCLAKSYESISRLRDLEPTLRLL